MALRPCRDDNNHVVAACVGRCDGIVTDDPQFLYITAIGLLVAGIHIADMVRRKAHDPTRWAMTGALLSGAAGYLFQIPEVYHHIDAWLDTPNLSILLSYAAFVLCAAFVHVWIIAWPGIGHGAPVGRQIRRVGAVTVGGIAALSLLFAAGHHQVEQPTGFVASYVRDGCTAAMIFGYLGLFAGMWMWVVVRLHRGRIAVAASGTRWLGYGLVFLEAGLAIAALYTVIMAADPLSILIRGTETTWSAGAVGSMRVISGTLACLGFSSKVWGPQWERYLRGRGDEHVARMQYRQLVPLYRLVVSSGNDVFRPPRGLGLRRRDPETALTHQVCAIIEARNRLAAYRDPEIEAVAVEWGRALTEAILLTAAARTHSEDRSLPPGRTAEPGVDMRQEIDRYLRLASALTMWQAVPNGARSEFTSSGSTGHPSSSEPATTAAEVDRAAV